MRLCLQALGNEQFVVLGRGRQAEAKAAFARAEGGAQVSTWRGRGACSTDTASLRAG